MDLLTDNAMTPDKCEEQGAASKEIECVPSTSKQPTELDLPENVFPDAKPMKDQSDLSNLPENVSPDAKPMNDQADLSNLPETVFPDAKQVYDKTGLSDALMARNSSLTQTPRERIAILVLVDMVYRTLQHVILLDTEIRGKADIILQLVGSLKHGTMRTGHNEADIVMILIHLPTLETVEEFAKLVVKCINRATQNDVRPRNEPLWFSINECGFTVHASLASVRVLVTTQPRNFKWLDPDVHLDKRLMSQYLAAVRHSKWFENNSGKRNIHMLIRVLRDMQNRFAGLADLNPWMIVVLAHFTVWTNSEIPSPLPLFKTFGRVFQLLAAHLCLTKSKRITDPCEENNPPLRRTLTDEQQRTLCITAQTIARVLAFGGYKNVLDFNGEKSISENMSVWGGLLVYPANKAYQEVEAAKDDAVVEVASDVVI